MRQWGGWRRILPGTRGRAPPGSGAKGARISQFSESVAKAEAIIAEYGQGARQHVSDLAQAAVREGVANREIDRITVIMRIVEDRTRRMLV